MANAKVTATIDEEGIKVTLENWNGVTNVMIERIHYAIIRQSQVFRAVALGELHKEKMAADNARLAEASSLTEGKQLTLDEEFANVLGA